MRALIDTNVLLDYFGRREPFFSACEKLCAMQAFGDIELWAAPQSYADVFYILRKTISSADLQSAFIESLNFINVCKVSHEEVAEASRRSWDDYENCLIALCAENIDADYLLTRDEDGFQAAKMPVFSPAEFFAMLESEHGLVYDAQLL